MNNLILPAIANTHSHAFQRAMAGLTERRGNASDSFWTWRELMYRFASKINPEQMRAIATQAYAEMLQAGFCQVCEFHYLHHQPNGQMYDDASEMSQAIIQAASDVGIGLTLLPVLYQTGGFDGRELHSTQKRFAHSTENYLRLINQLKMQENAMLKIGVALHSLRAVPASSMHELLTEIAPQKMPIHIHISEQQSEVDECVALRGARPVQWLLENVDINENWCLVHATHMNEQEVSALANCKAVVSICTSTEANLGDGIFPFRQYLDFGGKWAVGSDSNTSISLQEELRWLEYGQRLLHQHRNIASSEHQNHVGEFLLQGAQLGGWQASGIAQRDDFIELDAESPLMIAATADMLADCFVFAGNVSPIQKVTVNGIAQVQNGKHISANAFAMHYKLAMLALLQ